MADEISFISGLPVKFGLIEESCLECDDRDFCQLANFSDPCNFLFYPSTTAHAITNGSFTGSLTGWTSDIDWTYHSGKARVTASTGSQQCIYQNVGATIGKQYKLIFTISNFSGDGGLTVSFGGCDLYPYTFNSNGTFTIYAEFCGSSTLTICTLGGDTLTTLDLDDISLELVNTEYTLQLRNRTTGAYSDVALPINVSGNTREIGFSFTWFDFDIDVEGCYVLALNDGNDNYVESECYHLKEDHCCSYLFSYHNNEIDAFDVPYSSYSTSLVRQYLRSATDIRNPSYKGNSEKYIDSGDQNFQYFGKTRKLKELIIGEAPEYLHDAIAVMMKHSHIYIDELNQERYVFEDDDYTPEWDSKTNLKLAQARTLIGKYNGK